MSAPSIQNETTLSRLRRNRLRLLSYNLQVGIGCQKVSDYLKQSWRHLLPDRKRQQNLERVAEKLKDFDVAALQEVDAGSLRTRFINQVDFLAQRGGFHFWYQQRNRNLGQFAAHSNGLLSQIEAQKVTHHRLPGRIPGRGLIEAHLGQGEHKLVIFAAHLALSQIARSQQLGYIASLARRHRYYVLLGDMNCPRAQVADEFYRQGLRIYMNEHSQPTFPSWRPRLQFDQIWVSEGLTVKECQVLQFGVSDHLPIAMEIELPESLTVSLLGELANLRQAG